ncbi:MAG: hypothetical protein RI900_3535, partial [Actinomycetota bacterium]
AHDQCMTQQHFVFNSLVEYLEQRQQRRDDRGLARPVRSTERPQPTTVSVEPASLPVRPVLRPIVLRRLGRNGLATPAHDSLG